MEATSLSLAADHRIGTFAIIVPTREGDPAPRCLKDVDRLCYPKDKVTVCVVEGNNPSRQRNLGASQATADYLYFLDDDSELDRNTLLYVNHLYNEFPDIAGVGGPALAKRDSSLFERCVWMAMGSIFGLGPVRKRYYPSGVVRSASENELICCNLSIRNSVWSQFRGFEDRLYPNEENELIHRLNKNNYRFLYHPLAIVYRSFRGTLWKLCVQNFFYGMSRAYSFRVAQNSINVVLFLPMVLACLGISLFISLFLSPSTALVLAVFLAVYAINLIAASTFASLAAPNQGLASFALFLRIFPVIHFSYGIGTIAGLISNLDRSSRKTSRIISAIELACRG